MAAATGSGAISWSAPRPISSVPWRDGTEGGIKADQGLNGSLRGRAGIALDRFLLYGTAGLAGTKLELSSAGDSDDKDLWGWTAGAGVEGMITDNITARIDTASPTMTTRLSTLAALT